MSALQPKPARVQAALEAAAISPAKCGSERTRRLSEPERDLYRWILDRFAHATRPTAEAVNEHARSLGLEPAAALVNEDLARTDEQGGIIIAYPFSARPRGHRVLIDNKLAVEAMCALDALGIAPMLNLAVEISSRDPVTNAEIWVREDPGDGAWWEPAACRSRSRTRSKPAAPSSATS